MYEVESRFEVDGKNRIPLLLCHPHHESVFCDTGIVDKNVNVSELCKDFRNHIVSLFKISCIGCISSGFHPECFDFLHRCLGSFVDYKIGEGDVCTF